MSIFIHSPSPTSLGVLPSTSAAAYLCVASTTLANWRVHGEGPPYIRLGRKHSRIMYRVADLDAYLAARVVGGAR